MKERLNILILGHGARESAIAWKLRQSCRTASLYMAPYGIPGVEGVRIDPLDFDAVARFVANNGIDMVIPGGEGPIVAGIADALSEVDVKVIAPDAACARLEGSKEFAKEFMSRHSIPTARFMTVTPDWLEEGLNFIDSLHSPYVLKADGLAHGKGVIICDTADEAKQTLRDMLDGMFGEASSTVVIEEFVAGKECSVFLAVDGEDYLLLPEAKDYKKIGEGDRGPNTAGMGAVSPVPFVDAEFMEKVERRIIQPTLRGLREEGLDFRGFLFLGLMEQEGEPVLIEYNVRLGDPEAEAILPRIESDIVDVLEGIADRTLALKRLQTSDLCSAAVVLAERGYPGPVDAAKPVEGLNRTDVDYIVFPGETLFTTDNLAFSDGGRVATVEALGASLPEAIGKALAGAGDIHFDGKYYRRDIGFDLLGPSTVTPTADV